MNWYIEFNVEVRYKIKVRPSKNILQIFSYIFFNFIIFEFYEKTKKIENNQR